ncbi:Mitochondrial substrate carrier family protein ucpB [Diplonema papillatum]|nr:Mitochondrial substrate carrier family protein ucpB [Diplonema papillatum]
MSSDSASTGFRIVLAGSSACCGASVTNPIDVVKIRMQVQKAKYPGMLSGMRTIAAEEGLRGLYKGLGASLCREMSYSGIRFGAYESFKELYGATDPKNTPLYKKLAAGASAGMFGSAVANPCDLVKIRMQSDHSGKLYRNVFQAFGHIFKTEGFGGLYVGVFQTVQRAGVLGACQAPAYDHTKHTLKNAKLMDEGIYLHLVSSFVAGIVAVSVTAPIDLIKTRVMSSKPLADGTMPYTGTVDCFMKTVRSEGIMSLYAGWVPGWMRLGPHTIVTFLVFEQLRKVVGMRAI